MRKDINLLYSLTQTTKKKNSSNMMVLLLVVVVAIVALMIFLFVNAKMEVSDNQGILDDLEASLSQTGQLSALQNKYNQLKSAYESDIAEVIAEVSPGQYAAVGAKMSSKLIDILMPVDDEAVHPDYDADDVNDNVFDVDITSVSISGTTITLNCEVTSYIAAWDYADYLAGNLILDRPGLDALIEANALIFSGVEDNYPGLPPKPEPAEDEEGNIVEEPFGFTLRFGIDWAALADAEVAQ